MIKPVFLRPVHIVHIDDQPTGRQTVKAVLESVTYPQFVLHQFDRIKDAEDWATPNVTQIDSLLLDLTLADTEGMDTFMHAVQVFFKIPVIVLTGSANVDAAYTLVCAVADLYLSKDLLTQTTLPLFIAAAIARNARSTVSALQI